MEMKFIWLILIQLLLPIVCCQETKERFPDPRIVVVGHDGAGKTTFAKRLLGLEKKKLCINDLPFCAKVGRFMNKTVIRIYFSTI